MPPRPIVSGEPLLTQRSIASLEELAPWFSTLSLALTRSVLHCLLHSSVVCNVQAADEEPVRAAGQQQQVRLGNCCQVYSLLSCRSPADTIERIIEIDFMEEVTD